MKNLFYYFALSIVVFTSNSCSDTEQGKKVINENEINFIKRDGSALQIYYLQMIRSSSYLTFEVDKNEFVNKMNFGDSNDFIRDEIDMKNWLSNNISKTAFANIEEANNHFERLKLKYVDVINQNSQFFAEVTNPGFEPEFADIIESEPIAIASDNPCHNDCINDAVDCDRAARQNYAAQMGGSGLGYFWNPYIAAGAAVIATVIYHNAQGACVRTFNNCYAGC